jgi:precorrin-2 C20-methyltransferase/precorrin-3B C17-methyltransferase
VLLRHRLPECPVVVARDVGGAGEDVSVSTLGGFDAERVDMRTLLVVGSSTTRVIGGPGGRTLVYTPRSYP